jgi:predicted HTH transcriptional regulator
MDEAKVLSLISKGEDEHIDFKQELNLKLGSDKAEFIKDIISLANLMSGSGYLVIGVDDDGNIIGIDKLEEEQIQHIGYTYIQPPAILSCFLVSLPSSGSKSVGVIHELRP